MTLAQFAAALTDVAEEYLYQMPPVVDATEIEGRYDFTLNFSPPRALQNAASQAAAGDGMASEPTGAISLSEALERQLGLKLESRKVTAPVLVIDHVDEMPRVN